MSTDPYNWVWPAVGTYELVATTSSRLTYHCCRSNFCCSFLAGDSPLLIFQVTASVSSVSSNSSLSACRWPITSSMVWGTGVVFLLLICASSSAPVSFYCAFICSGLSGRFWTSISSLVPVTIMFLVVGLVIATVPGSEATFTSFCWPYYLGACAIRASGCWGCNGCYLTRLEGNADSCLWALIGGATPCF